MVPSESLLAVPFSVTVAPEATVWFEPALATGAMFAAPPLLLLLLLPPPPPHAVRRRVAMPARARPGVYLRMSLYTGAHRRKGVTRRLNAASVAGVSRELCTWSRDLILEVGVSEPFRISPRTPAKRAPFTAADETKKWDRHDAQGFIRLP